MLIKKEKVIAKQALSIKPPFLLILINAIVTIHHDLLFFESIHWNDLSYIDIPEIF